MGTLFILKIVLNHLGGNQSVKKRFRAATEVSVSVLLQKRELNTNDGSLRRSERCGCAPLEAEAVLSRPVPSQGCPHRCRNF